jgi:hypothetical protein
MNSVPAIKKSKEILEIEKKAAEVSGKIDLAIKIDKAIQKLKNIDGTFQALRDFIATKIWKTKFDIMPLDLKNKFLEDFSTLNFNKLDEIMQNDDLFAAWKNFRANHPNKLICN